MAFTIELIVPYLSTTFATSDGVNSSHNKDMCKNELRGLPENLLLSFRKFKRRPLIVEAKQALEKGFVDERGVLLPYDVGDWLVTEHGQKTHVMSQSEFTQGYEVNSMKIDGLQSYRKRSIIIDAVQMESPTSIQERGKLLPVSPSDWIVHIPGRPRYVLSDRDFKRVYEVYDAGTK